MSAVRLVHTTGGIFMPSFGEVEPTHIALPAAEFEAWKRVMLAASCWRDTVIFPNEENGSEVDLCAAVDAIPRDQQPGRAVEGT